MKQSARLRYATTAVFLVAMQARAQSLTSDPLLRTGRAPGDREPMVWAAGGALLAASLVFDERIRDVVLANRSPSLDRLTGGADILGTAGHIVPVLVSTYVVSRLLNKRSLADATLRVGIAYAAADGIEALLKPAVGRVRPDVGREPLTFRPFDAHGDFQSFPSAHVVHIASIATAVAAEVKQPWVNALAGVAIVYVGAQRVYRDQHWSSDVVASTMLGVQAAWATLRILHARGDANR